VEKGEMTKRWVIQDRQTRKSAKEAINRVHSEPKWGYVEATINAFTAMRHLPASKRIVVIILPEINGSSVARIIAEGTGFVNYDYVEKNIGYDTDSPEYIEQQKDPDYLNKMGIGIPSITSLSKEEIAEFRSVSINAKGQEEGLVATYTLEDGGGFTVPADHPNSQYVFPVGHPLNGTTGVEVIIKNAKYYRPDTIYDLLSETFARKLQAGYTIYLIGPNDKNARQVRSPDNFFCDRERVIGYVHDDKLNTDFPVYADIRQADKPKDMHLRVLMKKMTIDRNPQSEADLTEYQAKGYYGCDILAFKPDREGMSIDPYDAKHQQVEKLVLEEFRRQGIQKKPTEQMRNEKREKKWKQKATEVFLKYFEKNRDDTVLRVQAMSQTSPRTGKPEPGGKVSKPTRRCPNGQHWSKKLGACVVNTESIKPRNISVGPKTPRGPNTPHFPKDNNNNKRRRMDDEYTPQSIPNWKMARGSNPNKWLIWIDETESTIYFNFIYPWVEDVYENANDSTMEILYVVAFMNAVKQNRELALDQWLQKLAKSL
jgi:hypothetical protein